MPHTSRIKGPYLYTIFASYGYNGVDITLLFVTGYIASGVFGLFIGAAADRWGRRRSCVCFGILYIVSSLTIQVNYFEVLVAGRICSGISTSLLNTAFESWVVSEHQARGHSSATIAKTLALSTAGNGMVAVLSGFIGLFMASRFGTRYNFYYVLVLIPGCGQST